MPKLFNIAQVKVNFPDADFWIVRKGSDSSIGKPTRAFSSEYIGIKITKKEVIIPDYLFYAITHLHNVGYFKRIAKGTLSLQHITLSDIKEIRLG